MKIVLRNNTIRKDAAYVIEGNNETGEMVAYYGKWSRWKNLRFSGLRAQVKAQSLSEYDHKLYMLLKEKVWQKGYFAVEIEDLPSFALSYFPFDTWQSIDKAAALAQPGDIAPKKVQVVVNGAKLVGHTWTLGGQEWTKVKDLDGPGSVSVVPVGKPEPGVERVPVSPPSEEAPVDVEDSETGKRTRGRAAALEF